MNFTRRKVLGAVGAATAALSAKAALIALTRRATDMKKPSLSAPPGSWTAVVG